MSGSRSSRRRSSAYSIPGGVRAPPRRDELLRQGIAPGGETPLHLFLDTSRTRAVGYRLYLFYPL